MQCDLRYGKGNIRVGIPHEAIVTVLRKPDMPIINAPRQTILDALANPIAVPQYGNLIASAKSACIAICDITRPVPNHLFLRPLITHLVSAGVPLKEISVIVATGLHRPNEGAELRELVGDSWVLENVRVVNHFARNDSDHVSLGKTKRHGTVVRLDRRFVDADIRIATGLVEPHFMAGYSGGRKVVAPGLAHAETITTFHNARFMADPAASSCNLRGNPLHEEQLEIIEMLGGALALNTVIDEHRNLSFVNFGEIIASHFEAVEFVRPYCEVKVDRKFKTVITSAAGYPLDKTYYQTIKGMVGAMGILEQDADLIIASECSEGMGSPEFVDAQRRLAELGPDAFLKSLFQKPRADVDEWQTQMQLKSMEIGNIYLYSTGLPLEAHKLTGVKVVSSLENAIETSVARSIDRMVAVIPEGPYVVPVAR